MSSNPAPTEGATFGAGTREGAPRHVAIIMDGNGRWAERHGLPRAAGHRSGAEAVRTTLKAAVKAGVEVLTLYAFSSENWRRSEDEISDLKGLMGYYLERELDECGFLRNLEARPSMVRNLRNMFQRADLTEQEVRTLHGMIKEFRT